MTVPLYNLTDTWSSAGLDAILMSVTTGGNSGNLLRLVADSSTKLTVDASGNLSAAGSLNASGFISIYGNGGTGQAVLQNFVPRIYLGYNDSAALYIGVSQLGYAAIGFVNGIALSGTPDTFLWRETTGVLSTHNFTTNACTLRVYNTFTDSSNYERGVFDWTTTANTLTIGTQAAGTGTLRNTNIAGAAVSLLGSGTYGLNVASNGQIAMVAGGGSSGAIRFFETAPFNGSQLALLVSTAFCFQSTASIIWSPAGQAAGNSTDTGLGRAAAQVLQFDDSNPAAAHGGTFSAVANTPGTLSSGTTNNYAISQASYFQRLTANAANSTLTGISVNSAAQVDGEVHVIINIAAAGTLTLNHQDAGSTAANRFLNSTGAAIVLSPNQAADLIYDGTASRWLVFKRN